VIVTMSQAPVNSTAGRLHPLRRGGWRLWHRPQFTGIVALAALLVAACEEDNGPTGAAGVALAGTYAATFTVRFTNGFEAEQASEPGTVTLLAQGAQGAFAGSYLLEDGSSGVLDGVVGADGAITIVAFGAPNQRTLTQVRYLRQRFPYCDWLGAALTEFSGAVTGTGLTLIGSATLTCRYVTLSGPAVAPTTVSLAISGARG